MIGSVNFDYTFHDRQETIVSGPVTTTSNTFVSISGASITTKDLNELATYEFWVSVELTSSSNNSTISLRGCVDGTPTASRAISFGPNSAGDPQTIALIGKGIGVPAGTVIDIEWSVSGGTATLNSLKMMVDGIVDDRVVA